LGDKLLPKRERDLILSKKNFAKIAAVKAIQTLSKSTTFRNSRVVRSAYFRLPQNIRIRIRTQFYQNSFSSLSNFGDASFSEQIIINSNLDLLSVEEFLRNFLDNQKDFDFICEVRKNLVGDATFIEKPTDSNTTTMATFDFWDTLIGRYVPAESIKKSVLMKISFDIWKKNHYLNSRMKVEELYARRVEIEAELINLKGEARIVDVYRQILDDFDLNESDSSFYAKLEGELEIRFTQPLPEIFAYFDQCDRKKGIVSDYYGENPTLRSIINRYSSNPKTQYDVVVSSEHLATKRDAGKLFSFAGIEDASSWIHIGDNPVSDGENASRKGARTTLVNRLHLSAWNGHAPNMDELADQLSSSIGHGSGTSFLSDLSVVCYTLITSGLEEAIKTNRKKIVYLSREGWILADSHKRLISILEPYQISNIESVHFECSRASTFFASYADDIEAGLMAMSYQYPFSSGTSISESMGLTEKLAHLVKSEIGISAQINTKVVWTKLSEETRQCIKDYLSEQASFIREYLKDLDISPENSILCDVGWRGTIQDSLSRIVGRDFDGVYLGLYRPFEDSISKGRKNGVLIDENSGTNLVPFLNFFGPLERAMTIPGYQVLRYENQGNKLKIKPVLTDSFDGPSNARKKLIDDSFEEVSDLVFKKLSGLGIFGNESTYFAAKTLLNWYTKPTFVHGSTWFSEGHRESFGVTEGQHYFHPSQPRSNEFYPLTELKLGRIIQQSQWSEGFIAWMTTSIKYGGSNE
jgi:hypothetical protein